MADPLNSAGPTLRDVHMSLPEELSRPRIERAAIDGPTLREARTSRKVALRVIARRTGMSHGHLSKVERGEYGRPVTPAILQAYETTLGIKINQDLLRSPATVKMVSRKGEFHAGQMARHRRRAYVAAAVALSAGGYLGDTFGRLVDSAGVVVEPTRLGVPEANQLTHIARSLAPLDLRRAGGIGGPLALVIVRWEVKLLALVEPEQPVAEPLHAAVSMLAVRAAWWKVDTGCHDAARALFQLALYCAAQSDHPDLRARTLADIAAHHARVGYGVEALEILRFAQGDERVSAEVRTLVAEVRQRATTTHGRDT